jgi:outer membrane receptor protein involved in Fe transport
MDSPPPDILVTGRALAPPAFEAPLPRTVLDADTLRTASGRVEDALLAVPGLTAFRRASTATASPTAQGLSFRGLGGNAATRAAVTLDGVPQPDLFAGWIPWVSLSAARIERAVVTRGGGSVADGPGALTGAIQIETAPPASGTTLKGGSRDSLDLGGHLALPAGAGAFDLSGQAFAGDGHLLVDSASAGPADVPARYRQWAVRARAIAPAAATTELQATLSAFDDNRLRGFADSKQSASGADLSVRLVHKGPVPAEALLYAQMRDFTARIRTPNASRTATTLTLDQFATPAAGWGGRVELRPLTGLRTGLDWRQASGETQERFRFVAGSPTALRVAGGRTASAGLFAEAGGRVRPNLTLSGGVRVDRWHLSDGSLTEQDLQTGQPIRTEAAPDRSGTRWSARGGAEATVPGAEAITLSATGYTGWRLPTLNELHRPFRAGQDATAANPELAPERLTGLDARLRYAPLATLSFEAGGFVNRLEDAIANVTLASGPGVFPGVGFVAGQFRQRRNLPAIDSRGAEAGATLRYRNLDASARAAWSFATVDGGSVAPDLTGLRPAQSPVFAASLSLAWDRGPLGASLLLTHESTRFEDDRNTRTLASATRVDLGARYRIGRRILLTADVLNATDAFIEAGFSGTLPERAEPRTILMGLEIRP